MQQCQQWFPVRVSFVEGGVITDQFDDEIQGTDWASAYRKAAWNWEGDDVIIEMRPMMAVTH